jgi:TonB family protein
MFQTRIVHQPNRRTLYASLLIHTALIGILWSRSFITTTKRADIIPVVYAADWEPLNTPITVAAVKPLPNPHPVIAALEFPHEVPAHIAELSDIDVSSNLPESALEDRAKSLAALISENSFGVDAGIPEPPPIPDVGKETNTDDPALAEPPPAPPPVRIGGNLQTAHIVHQVSPVYPHLARTGRIQGIVVIDAVITQSGSLKDITVRSGHPLLIDAAVDCVRQWKYQPAILNGVPVESPVHIQVQFRLQPAISGD